MGWASRAKQANGNPTRPKIPVRIIKADAVLAQRRLGLDPVVRFGDTDYVLNASGELRCQSRQPAAARS